MGESRKAVWLLAFRDSFMGIDISSKQDIVGMH